MNGIKHFMTDYLGLLAYSDWLRDKGKEEEAIAFLDAIAEERGWSEGEVGSNSNGNGHGYGYGDADGNGYSYSRNGYINHYDFILSNAHGDGNATSIIYGYGDGNGQSAGKRQYLYPTEE